MTQKITLILTRLMLIGLLFVFILPAQAGVMASRTRVIYEQGQTERSLMLANINPYPVVVQTWVNDGEDQQAPEKSTSPMIALPSVFRMQPGAVQGLRILYNGDALPKDRESVFWINLYEIAPKSGATPAPEAAVALAMNTQMKICRGSGVLVKVGSNWKIKHYVLSMTIPNDNTSEVIKIIAPIEDGLLQKGFSK